MCNLPIKHLTRDVNLQLQHFTILYFSWKINALNNEDDKDGKAREYQGQSVTPSKKERWCASYITTSPIYMLISDWIMVDIIISILFEFDCSAKFPQLSFLLPINDVKYLVSDLATVLIHGSFNVWFIHLRIFQTASKI